MSLLVHPLAGQRVGYARISSVSQNLDGQTDALRVAGCEKVFADTASGKLAERPELSLCLGYLRAGDTLVVWRLDRLGRSLRHLVETVNALAGRGVAFASLHDGYERDTVRRGRGSSDGLVNSLCAGR
jgi:DNA invertase Pin-like site-specific DNA recombinase